MNSTILIKFLGGLFTTAGIGTGGYFIKNHFSKSEEKKPNKEGENQKVDGAADTQTSVAEPKAKDTVNQGVDTKPKNEVPPPGPSREALPTPDPATPLRVSSDSEHASGEPGASIQHQPGVPPSEEKVDLQTNTVDTPGIKGRESNEGHEEQPHTP